MKTLISINFVCYDYVGQDKYKIFIDEHNNTPVEELLVTEPLEECMKRLSRRFFEVDSKWVLLHLTLVDVKKFQSTLIIEYSCLVPELQSKSGKFVSSNNLANLANILHTLRT